MKLSFIGLGAMGRGMALNLAGAGTEYIVCDVNERAFEDFKVKGIKCTTDKSKTADAYIIFLCLPDEKIVNKILFAEDGIADKMRPGQIIVDCSTVNYLSAVEIAGRLEDLGIEFMDAPVSGMQARAEEGTLAIMCGGKKEIYDTVKPYLDLMGTNVQHMGRVGNGQLTKMINNCIYNVNCAAIAEMLAVAAKLGLDPEQIGSVVNSGTARSHASEYFIPRMLNRDFAYNISMQAAYKDLINASEVCMVEALPTPVLDSATSVYKAALLKGLGGLYKGAMLCVYEDLMGIRFTKKE